MKKYFYTLAAALVASTAVMAEGVEVSGGVDFVSNYNWRGMEQSGPALQPGMAVSVAGFTLGAWGSSAFDCGDTTTTTKELDFTLGYEVANFGVSVTSYWWAGENEQYFAKSYSDLDGKHQTEVSLSYSFANFPLSISWSTMVAGDLDKKGNLAAAYSKSYDEAADYDDQMYSTYINFGYDFAVEGIDCSAFLGVTPWAGAYSGSYTTKEGEDIANGFGVASVGVRFSKDLLNSDKFSMPLFVETSFSPAQKNAYLTAGLSFAL